MTPENVDAAAALNAVDRARVRTRALRSGHRFASVVSGVVILGAMPFCVRPTLRPAALAGLVILGLVMWENADRLTGSGDFWIRGTSVLVVIAAGLLVLSALGRSRPFMIFTVAFFGSALLSCLYDLVNPFTRLHVGGPFQDADSALPNLVLPGAFLLVGGVCFLVARGWRLRSELSRPLS